MASVIAFAPSSSAPASNPAASRQRQAASTSKPAPVLDLPALQGASRVLLEQLNRDAQSVPELNDFLSNPNVPSSVAYNVSPDDFRVPFQKGKLISIPNALFQHYSSTNVSSHMGLLPEIERVWITVDHDLFLWDYVEGQDTVTYSEQTEIITHVALVKPQTEVFVDEITYLLVICTPINVQIIGTSATPVKGPNNQVHKAIQLYATDLSVATDVEMTSVVCTHDGRIFMCGVQDGCLYEFHYQAKEGWFGKRVQLINHSVGGFQSFLPRLTTTKLDDRIISVVADHSRKCFYTLTEKNIISTYRAEGDKTIQNVQTMSNLFKQAQDRAKSPVVSPQNFQIISIHVVNSSDSRTGIQLMAITSNGVRLYFAPSPTVGPSYGFSGASSSGSTRPLQLVHVRLPPPDLIHPDELSNPHRPAAHRYGLPQTQDPVQLRTHTVTGLDVSCYDAGLTIAAQLGDTQGTDYVLCMSPDLPRIASFGQVHGPPQSQPGAPYPVPSYGAAPGTTRPPLTEQATMLAIPGRTWAVAPVPRPSAAGSAVPPGTPTPVVINELANQVVEPARQFMILTNVGLTFVAKRRALDCLRDAIQEFQVESNAQPLIGFRDSFGRDQTCAMLLAIASGNTFLDLNEQSSLGGISTISPELASVAKQAFYDFGERPMWSERVNYGTGGDTGTAIFSGRREGFALYIARLVRPFWKAKFTRPGPTGLQELNVPDEVLITIQKNLMALKELLDTNPHLFHSAPGDHTGARSAATTDQEAWKAEQTSVAHLLALLYRTIEAISFILLLSDHQLGELIKNCEPDIQQVLSTITFEELVTDQKGVNAARALIGIVINRQIGQQISVDTISEVLQQRCGSFCSTDDVMLYKAKELVRKAAETRNTTERQNWLGESLGLFMKGARNLDIEKLRGICGDYQHLAYPKGAISLALCCANAYDPDGQGRAYWYAGRPANDPRAQFLERRMNCYDLVLHSLEVFEKQSHDAMQTGGHSIITYGWVRDTAYELAFQSTDEIFHSTFYDSLINRGMADRLLKVRPPYLEAHLRREPVSAENLEFLWQFYVRIGSSLEAAKVLSTLAESTDFDFDLPRRLEYLTLAVSNAKSNPVTASNKRETAIAYLTELEDKLAVAQVQLELYNTLAPLHKEGEARKKIDILRKGFLSITELYQEYAEPFDLPVIKLLILHVSEFRDGNVVRPIWKKIFEDAIGDAHDQPKVAADRIVTKVVPLGQRFYPSESAFPPRYIATLLQSFSINHKGEVPHGWAPRILIQCGVPYPEAWDIFNDMYEAQVPPFNEQANVQATSSDIAVLLNDWVEEAKRPQSTVARDDFPVYRIDKAVEKYLKELEAPRRETRSIYENIKRQLPRHW
ncbi:nucleoporin [Wolfiporia cocos MD-104 SS10]|uniref:Nucleoporin n=1 Tax=Wolfiporia cocos (strain MD-104) TaxID=742152 RepID=A0A2H3IUR5_WOLCO|nr:nucleoporin [Wolfiporia cocos MD-104 SS10]